MFTLVHPHLNINKIFVFLIIRLLEEGGSIFVFKGEDGERWIKSALKVHNPLFYWKVWFPILLGLILFLYNVTLHQTSAFKPPNRLQQRLT